MGSEVGTWKDGKTGKEHPVIRLFNKPDDQWKFTFGFNKAKLILYNLDAIRVFVAEQEAAEPSD